jgi:hypothetical protein
MAEELFLFVHLPKTGGQTLRNCFIKHLEFHRTFIHLGPYGEKKATELGLSPFHERPPEERARARVILGHGVNARTHELVPGKIPRHITFLRDPAELLVSLYNFEMKYNRPADQPMPSFEQWYLEGGRRNFVTQWFLSQFLQTPQSPTPAALRTINSALESFWFVGCSEFIDRDAPLLLRRIGVPAELKRTNVGGINYPKLMSLDDSLRKRLMADNELDYELYRQWRNRLDKSVARIRAEIRPPS